MQMVRRQRHANDGKHARTSKWILTQDFIQCATKSIILHLQWTEEEKEEGHGPLMLSPQDTGNPFTPQRPGGFSPSPAPRTVSSLSRSTTSYATPGRRSSMARSHSSYAPSVAGARARLSLNPSSPATPMTPVSQSTPIYFGRAAVLTAPPKLVGVVETPDVAVGAVDPSKRRVVTATRFSTRSGAARTVRSCTQSIHYLRVATNILNRYSCLRIVTRKIASSSSQQMEKTP